MSVHACTQQIRDFITHSRRQAVLLRNRPTWLQLTTALDVIEDTELAVEAYRAGDSCSVGDLYLQIFGVLQAVFLQQDAVAHLAEALGVTLDFDAHPRLKDIRDIRNDVAGHPTSRRGGQSFHALVRIEMRRNAVNVASSYKNAPMEIRAINLLELLDDQRDLTREFLDDILTELQRRDTEYRAMHRDRKLAAVFPENLDYYLGKISEVTGFANDRQALSGTYGTTAAAGLDVVRARIENLDAELKRRDLTRGTYDVVDYDLRWIELCVERLGEYLDAKPGAIDAETAYVYCSFLKTQLDDLKNVLREIDDDFASE